MLRTSMHYIYAHLLLLTTMVLSEGLICQLVVQPFLFQSALVTRCTIQSLYNLYSISPKKDKKERDDRCSGYAQELSHAQVITKLLLYRTLPVWLRVCGLVVVRMSV
jgi:hypothetical protein